MKTLYQEVYDVLHHTNWKVAKEVRNDVAYQRKVDPETLSLHRFYPILHTLVDEGLAENRESNISPEHLATRGGRPSYEYKLTSAGLKKRVESTSSEGIEGILAPAKN